MGIILEYGRHMVHNSITPYCLVVYVLIIILHTNNHYHTILSIIYDMLQLPNVTLVIQK